MLARHVLAIVKQENALLLQGALNVFLALLPITRVARSVVLDALHVPGQMFALLVKVIWPS
jgi:hypothetical protein